MPEDKELPSLKKLGEKIKQAQHESAGKGATNSAPGAMHVSVDLLAGVLGGSFIGYYLDKWLGTMPVFFIICFFLGIAGAVRNILRSIRNADKEDE
jgi:ATP synthase protein I